MILSISDFFQYDFLIRALMTTIFLALSTGLISPFILAKRYSFIGPAISHSTLLGISLSMVIFQYTSGFTLFFSTLLITLVLTSILAKTTYKQKLPSDSLIGVFFTTTMSIGILIQSSSNAPASDISGLLFGNIFLVDQTDLIISICVFLIISLSLLIPFKKWLYLITDIEGATISGIKTKLYHYTFFTLLTILIISSIKLAGSILINALILIPGITALALTSNIKKVFCISIGFSLVTTILGLILSNAYNLQSGAIISVVQFIAMLVLLAPQKMRSIST